MTEFKSRIGSLSGSPNFSSGQGVNCLVIIPARGGSKGVPRKNLATIHGKSLVEWAMQVGLEIPGAQVLLSSDDDKILAEGTGLSRVLPRKRPAHLALDSSDDQSVLLDSIDYAEGHLGMDFDEVLMLQPTSPSRTASTVLKCLNLFREGGYSAVWTVDAVDSKFHPYKQLSEVDGVIVPSQPTGRPWRRQELPPSYIRNGECYVFSKNCVIQDSTLMGDKCGFVVSGKEAVNIDTENDLSRARDLLHVDKNGRLSHVK